MRVTREEQLPSALGRGCLCGSPYVLEGSVTGKYGAYPILVSLSEGEACRICRWSVAHSKDHRRGYVSRFPTDIALLQTQNSIPNLNQHHLALSSLALQRLFRMRPARSLAVPVRQGRRLSQHAMASVGLWAGGTVLPRPPCPCRRWSWLWAPSVEGFPRLELLYNCTSRLIVRLPPLPWVVPDNFDLGPRLDNPRRKNVVPGPGPG